MFILPLVGMKESFEMFSLVQQPVCREAFCQILKGYGYLMFYDRLIHPVVFQLALSNIQLWWDAYSGLILSK